MVGSAYKAPEGQIYTCPVCNGQFPGDVEYCPTDHVRLVVVDRPDIDRVGEVIAGRYHIKGVLGSGGMGTVYRAVQEPIGREVAIKILHPDLANDETFVSRFHTEAKAASVLVNPNTVTIHDFGQTDDGTLFLAMEHLNGVSLADRLSDGALPWKHAVAIGVQVCRALAEAHRKGIVHRDLKPENIMLSAADDGSAVVKVLDFGIAKMLEVPGRSLTGVPVTQVGVIIGTPQYMSPEQARGGEPNPASDLYALGIILFEAISGMAPFDDDEPIVTLSLHMRSPVPTLASPFGAVPFALSNLIGALLRKDPKSRPGPADDIGRSLKRMVGVLSFPAEEIISPPAHDLELEGDLRPDENLEEIDLTEALDAPTDEEAEDLSITRPNQPLPEYVGQGLSSALDEDLTFLTELPPPGANLADGASLTLEIDEAEEEIEPKGSPDEVTRPIHLPSETDDEDEPRSTSDQGKTTVRSVEASPLPAPVAPPRSPAPRKVVQPPTTPLSQTSATDHEGPPRRRSWLWISLVVLVVLAAGAGTGLFIISEQEDRPSMRDEQTNRAAIAGGEVPLINAYPEAGTADTAPAASDETSPLGASPESPSESISDAGPTTTPDAGPTTTPDAGSTPEAAPLQPEPTVVMTEVTFRSSPAGARVYLGDVLLCETPCQHELPTGEPARLRFERSNGVSRTRTVVPGTERTVRINLSRRHRPQRPQRPQPPAKNPGLEPWLD